VRSCGALRGTPRSKLNYGNIYHNSKVDFLKMMAGCFANVILNFRELRCFHFWNLLRVDRTLGQLFVEICSFFPLLLLLKERREKISKGASFGGFSAKTPFKALVFR